MKNILLLFIALLITNKTNAQITITADDLPMPGVTVHRVQSDNPQTYTVSSTGGANQNWNYAANLQIDDSSNFTWAGRNQLLNHNLLPAANIGILYNNNTYCDYYQTTNNGLYYLGQLFRGIQDSLWISNPTELVMPVPFTYNNTIHHVTKYIYLPYDLGGGTWQKRVTLSTEDFTADAWGTLTNPYYVNVPALRMKGAYTYQDSFFIADDPQGPYEFSYVGAVNTASYYTFVKKGDPYAIMDIRMDHFGGTPTSVVFWTNFPTTGTNDIPMASPVFTTMAPNPTRSANINIMIEGQGATWLRVYNLLGQELLTENIAGVNTTVLNDTGLKSGVYLYYITDANGKLIEQKKFIIEN